MSREQILTQRRLCALVTGASSGIGEAFARLMAERNHDIVLVARREDLLQKLASELEAKHHITATVLPTDLGTADGAATLVAQLEERGIEVDVLFNNAGYMMDGHYLKFSWSEHEACTRLMTVTPAELIHRLLPGMLERDFGQVINLASAAGLMPSTPFNTLYGPSKVHMISLTRSLASELKGSGISFTACCPAVVTDTGIIESEHGKGWKRFGFILVDPRTVVEQAYAAVEQGKTVQLVGMSTYGMNAVGRILPTAVWSRVMARAVMFLSKEKRIESARDAGL